MIKKCWTSFLVFGLALLLGASTVSAAVTSDNEVISGLSNGKYFVVSYFNPSHRVEAGEGYDLKTGRYVKQAYVRAKSDGLTIYYVNQDTGVADIPIKICASYDSGRSYSAVATSKKNTIMKTPKEVVPDCATCTQRLSYGWLYF